MKNEYYIMRHGESVNNLEHIIISDPANGLNQYGLTDKGQSQASESAEKSGLGSDVVIFSSDFLRAKETAEIVRESLGAQPVIYDERLRERFFGTGEGGDDRAYDWVWEEDEVGKDVNQGIETFENLEKRIKSLINEIEYKYNSKKILFVSHGDPLQVINAIISGEELRRCHQYGLYGNAEIKKIQPHKLSEILK